jgi:hypothetical protein
VALVEDGEVRPVEEHPRELTLALAALSHAAEGLIRRHEATCAPRPRPLAKHPQTVAGAAGGGEGQGAQAVAGGDPLAELVAPIGDQRARGEDKAPRRLPSGKARSRKCVDEGDDLWNPLLLSHTFKCQPPKPG